MSPTRAAARRTPFPGCHPIPPDAVSSAYALRDDWLRRGLRTDPSDRPTAEAAVTELYRRLGAPEPEFVWVPSPAAVAEAVLDRGLRCAPWSPRPDVALPMSGRIATLFAAARHRMDLRIVRHREGDGPRTVRSAASDTSRGLRARIQDPLRATLLDGVAAAIRTLIREPARAALGLPWYGQQEAHRVGFYDVLRRHSPVRFRRDDDELLDLQVALADSTGWWWSYEKVCVLCERPRALRTEADPGGVRNERRLHHDALPAVEFADGAQVYAVHGAIVPEWVVRDPNAERIGRVRDAALRSIAVDRVGWDAYLTDSRLELVAAASDPARPGFDLRLYEVPSGWGGRSRLLLATDWWTDPEGTRRTGLLVPNWIDDPITAAGWTYGVSGDDYARLVRRT